VQIRSEQMTQISQEMQHDYHSRLMREFRRTSPVSTRRFDDATLLSSIASADDKCKRYGIEAGAARTVFITIAVLVHSDFDEAPAVQRFLRMPELDAEFKLQFLAELLARALRARSA
jgi:hypothetical protein